MATGPATTTISDPIAKKKRLQSIEEIANIYGHHPSFYGWYWPDEAEINPYYTPEFIHYVNDLSQRRVSSSHRPRS